MEKTCKDCEHYKPYFDQEHFPAVMYCKFKKEHWDGIRCCEDNFTPKKPKEPDEKKKCQNCNRNTTDGDSTCQDAICDEITWDRFTPKKPKEGKSCKTCRDASHNNGTSESCNVYLGRGLVCHDSSHWRPILKEKLKEEKNCHTCRFGCDNTGTACSRICTTPDLLRWEPIPDLVEPEDKHMGSCCDCSFLGQTSRQIPCCACPAALNHPKFEPKEKPGQATIPPEYKITQATLDEHKRIGQEHAKLAQEQAIKVLTPKPKETEMNRTKKWIRRYVMGCTIYCTAVICTALNPWVCKFWNWIAPGTAESCHEEGSCFCMYVLPWGFTIATIALIVLAICAFNKATAFVFGKLEK